MTRNVSKFMYWAPRLLSIAFILFLMLFSLDVFTPDATPREILIGLFIHNLPALILVAVTVAAWRHELIGAAAFILAGVIYIGFAFTSDITLPMAFMWSLNIAGPAFLIGILYFLNWRGKHHPISR